MGAALFLCSLLLLAACESAPEAATLPAQPSPTLIPLQSPGTPVTLPPTWTPAPTSTSAPSATASPSPTITQTPQPSATFSAAALCEAWLLTSQPMPGISLPYGGFLSFLWAEGLPPDAQVILGFTHRSQAEEELLLAFPAGQLGTVLDITLLQRWGEFQWQAGIFLESYGEICPITGTFYREPWWAEPIPNPLSPPFAYN